MVEHRGHGLKKDQVDIKMCSQPHLPAQHKNAETIPDYSNRCSDNSCNTRAPEHEVLKKLRFGRTLIKCDTLELGSFLLKTVERMAEQTAERSNGQASERTNK